MRNYIFAYGTLLPRCGPAVLKDVLDRLKPVGPATMPGRLYDLGEYPGAVFDATAATRVHGQVLELPADSDVLPQIDRYEGFDPTDLAGSLFLRVKQTATLADGVPLECWVYVLSRDPGDARLVPDGDYPAWIGRAGERE